MDTDEVKLRVAEIEAMKDDDGEAHRKEDALHQDVLRAISEGLCSDPVECARLALTTLDIEFSHWYE